MRNLWVMMTKDTLVARLKAPKKLTSAFLSGFVMSTIWFNIIFRIFSILKICSSYFFIYLSFCWFLANFSCFVWNEQLWTLCLLFCLMIVYIFLQEKSNRHYYESHFLPSNNRHGAISTPPCLCDVLPLSWSRGGSLMTTMCHLGMKKGFYDLVQFLKDVYK